MGESVLDLLSKKEEKLPKRQEEVVDVTVIAETLKKLKEQIEIFPEFYERLNKIEANQATMKEQLTLVLSALNARLDLDRDEKEIMDLLKLKLQKGK